jgi:hypothetical protein
MNTGMQDAVNLSWKLAMVVNGTGDTSLLESYSAERSPIAAEVLKVTGRATNMATLTGDFTQSIRNHVASLVLGLAPVRKFAANVASEIAIGYPESPLNGLGGHADPAPGRRAPIRANEPAVGAGETPRFVLFAEPDAIPPNLLKRYANLVDPKLREPYHSGGIWLVRPDGYVALAVSSKGWNMVETYLNGVSALQIEGGRHV